MTGNKQNALPLNLIKNAPLLLKIAQRIESGKNECETYGLDKPLCRIRTNKHFRADFFVRRIQVSTVVVHVISGNVTHIFELDVMQGSR